MQEFFYKDGCLGVEPRKAAVFPSAIMFHFPQGNCFLHHLSQLTSTSTLGPNWMWTLSKGIGLTGGICSSIPAAFWRGPWWPMWQGGWWPDAPADGASHTVRIMTNHKNSHSESAVLQRGSLEPSHSILLGWHAQVVVSSYIKQGFRTSPQIPGCRVSLAGLSHWFERFYWLERAHGGLACVCKWVRTSFLNTLCLSVHASDPLNKQLLEGVWELQ